MFPVAVTIQNQAQLQAVMMALSVGNESSIPVSVEAAESVKDAAEKKPRATSAKTITATAHTPRTAEAGAADAEVPTYQATADAVTKLARVKGRDAAVAVLSKFSAVKLPDVKPEQFAAVIAACNQAMEG